MSRHRGRDRSPADRRRRGSTRRRRATLVPARDIARRCVRYRGAAPCRPRIHLNDAFRPAAGGDALRGAAAPWRTALAAARGRLARCSRSPGRRRPAAGPKPRWHREALRARHSSGLRSPAEARARSRPAGAPGRRHAQSKPGAPPRRSARAAAQRRAGTCGPARRSSRAAGAARGLPRSRVPRCAPQRRPSSLRGQAGRPGRHRRQPAHLTEDVLVAYLGHPARRRSRSRPRAWPATCASSGTRACSTTSRSTSPAATTA